jgi:hypothetical protein
LEDKVEQTLKLSLDGARKGRRIGFMAARQKAAQIILDEIKDVREAHRIYNLVMDLCDEPK